MQWREACKDASAALTSRLRRAQGPLGCICLPRMKHTRLRLVCGQPETLVGVVEAMMPGWPDKEYENSLCLDSWTRLNVATNFRLGKCLSAGTLMWGAEASASSPTDCACFGDKQAVYSYIPFSARGSHLPVSSGLQDLEKAGRESWPGQTRWLLWKQEQALGLHEGKWAGAGGVRGSRVKHLGCFPATVANVRTREGKALCAEESNPED